MEKERYNKYSAYLKEKYGEKTYKIPINIKTSCPNRDGNISFGGCSFCGEKGTGFENLSNEYTVKEQLEKNMAYIKKKYKARKFIAYFQNFTNTYLPLEILAKYIEEACVDDVVEIAISTRPDCISDEYLDRIKEISQTKNVEISFELGLQSINSQTLNAINRGHGLAEFIDAVLRINRYDFEICTHLILNLPGDGMQEVMDAAKIISALPIEQVKLHSLYIEKGTAMAQLYEDKKIDIISIEEYVERVCVFLDYLRPDMVVQRFLSRAPESETLFCNWNTSWWKIKDMIDDELESMGIQQGQKCQYLNGKALKIFEV